MCQKKKCCEEEIYCLWKNNAKGNMFWSEVLLHWWVITHYMVEGNNFVVIVCKLLEQQEYWTVILMIVLKLMVNKWQRCLKKSQFVRFANYERKIKSSFTIYTNVKSNLVPGNDRKQSRDKSYTKKYQKHVFYSYGYQLVCVDDKLCKPFK